MVYSVASPDFKETTTTSEVLKFLRDLLCVDVFGYCYLEHNITRPLPTNPPFRDEVLERIAYYEQRPNLQGVELGEVRHYSYSEIKDLTGNFSKQQLIQKPRCGRLFRAKLFDREVAIKTWDFPIPISSVYLNYPRKLVNELLMLSYGKLRPNPDTVLHPMEDVLKSNDNLAKVIGYSCDKILAVVYDLQSEKTVRDAIPTDTFDWKSRMKLAMELAQLVRSIHDCKHSLGSIDPGNIMIDKDGNFKLFVFGLHLLLGPKDESSIETSVYVSEGYGCTAPEFQSGYECTLIKIDIYAFGVLLFELITKQQQHHMYEAHDLEKESLVDASFKVNEDVGSQITELVRSCLHWEPEKRPEMSQIVPVLENIYDLLHHPQKRQYTGKDG